MLSSNTLGHPAIHARRKRRLSRKALGAALGLCMVVAALTTWLATRTHIVDLGNEQQLSDSGLLQDWAEGAVIVMIRHAERCDSAPGPCLDDPTGITVAGTQAATRVGQGLHTLGLSNADVLSSPKVRTRQTAHFILGQAVPSAAWLESCDNQFADEALARKRPGHNLVLVTHNGCIDHFQRQQRVVGGERESGYASALFVSVDGNGKARILGRLNEPDWQRVLASTGK
ncbi:histidine phosphatase family protein [Pseudomonas kermanshahensis]|jgi:phosphohistidine phosphatase SixA|uniref:lipopolysaccharide core heptose(II)-phosphate phosphatase PmrG n=1 Tax=Pseudomonas TaxID=286 RepID=UPI0004236A8F|nr:MULTISPECIES: histidine phosphatase family protein [Pseudomonas]ATP52216.1 histidine phosphatase family protein [Pseudomonas putida]MCX2687513.1 histidine phosphatase family protein [Pseudomonas sp. DCB_AW]MDE4536022.1 histidine phosphatase family protein [Pseudomonas sp. ITEM 17296]WEL54951.1 histidine phosphatase family protein [Pseudomonas kermanshahensis]SME96476.1 Phosphohistidine phosphatase SixA [Pseudomonas sp. LAIL14HWK12:I11]